MSYSTEVLADSPLIYWKLDETSGTTITDSSGNGRGGTLAASGVTYSVAPVLPFGSTTSLTFDGTNGAGSLASNINMDAYTSFTIEFWAIVAAFNNTDDMACELTTGGLNTAGGISLDACSGGGTWLVQAHAASGINRKTYTRPSTGVYHHYCFVFTKNLTTNAIKSYLDGALWTAAGTTETGPTDAAWANAKFYIASRAGTSLKMAMNMDEFAVYGTDLGTTRIAAHYTAGTTAPAATNYQPGFRFAFV